MNKNFSLILQGLVAAMNAAPQVIEVIDSAKNLIAALFKAGVINIEQQNSLHDYVDAHAALIASGVIVPSSAWTVEPNPS